MIEMALPTACDTDALARRLAPHLRAGDVLLLEGPIGAGKTHFARALIRELQRAAGQVPEEVPSPSFTLVQGYAAGDLAITHADLYRLSGPGEVAELGLDTDGLLLIEWPDRLGSETPPGALTLRFAHAEEWRALTLAPDGSRAAALAREAAGG